VKPTIGKIEDEYAYATECQLATLSWLAMKRSSPISEITRQRNICYHMLKVCQEHAGNIAWGRRYYSRVQDILGDAKNDNLHAALNRFTLMHFDRADDATRWLRAFEKTEKDKVPL
jgi:hypothetical protein